MLYTKLSIHCLTYNHAPFIRQTLDGFVMQKTNFPFEVLIHDDASTDGTADIIREYEAKYPDIIKPIYQTENQYSQGIKIGFTHLYPRAKGKYLAMCEGDDYWTDPFKLQKQYDALEQHPEADICAHAGDCVEAETKKHLRYVAPKKETCIIPMEEVIEGGGGFVVTNSLMYCKELVDNIPKFRQLLSLDYTTQMHGAMRGGMLYLSECMSAYRWLSKDSWTVKMQRNIAATLKFREKYRQMLLQLDEDTNGKYSSSIQKQLDDNQVLICKLSGEYKKLLSKEYEDIYKRLSKKERIKIRLAAYFPLLVKWKRRLTKSK